MQLIIDTDKQTLTHQTGDQQQVMPLYSKRAFELVSQQWVKIGWNERYSYTFSWFGRPIIQLPEDMVRTQEVIWRIQPDVIIETGIAHGGSLAFYASLCKAIGKGRVIGIDIEIRPHNRVQLEQHPLADYFTLIEGDSAQTQTVARVKSLVGPAEVVIVILDSCHTKQHVAAELAAYHELVSPGSYIVATDGLMKHLSDVPRGNPDWSEDHPIAAVTEFAATHPEFVLEQPSWPFNESELTENITHWPNAWLRRT